MVAINVLELNGDRVTQIEAVNSASWERRFYEYGTFTIEIDFSNPKAKELTRNRLVMIGNQNNKIGIIKYSKYTQTGNKKTLIVRGYELKGIFKQRITVPPSGQSHLSFTAEKAETVLKTMVQQNCIDTAGEEISQINIIADAASGIDLTLKTRYKNLSNELVSLGKISQLGHILTFNFTTLKFDFDVLQTTDKSASIFFSANFDNIDDQEYTFDEMNSTTYAYVGGQGDGSLRTIEKLGTTATGVEKSTMFVDARDINDSDDLVNRGNQRLSQLQPTENYNCAVYENTFKYEADWDIGDIVTIRNADIGIDSQLQIMGVTEWYVPGKDRTLRVDFGERPLSIQKYIDINNDYGIN